MHYVSVCHFWGGGEVPPPNSGALTRVPPCGLRARVLQATWHPQRFKWLIHAASEGSPASSDAVAGRHYVVVCVHPPAGGALQPVTEPYWPGFPFLYELDNLAPCTLFSLQ